MKSSQNRNSKHRLSEEEQDELVYRSQQGDAKAREHMIYSHLFLVDILVARYLGQGVDREDLYQEGCYGLICAIDRYDSSKGASIATYATRWIEKYLKSCIQKQNMDSPITLTEGIYYELKRYHRAYSILYSQLQRDPSDEEISKQMNLPPGTVKTLKEYLFFYFPLDSGFETDSAPPEYYLIPKHKLPPSAESIAIESLCPIDLSQYNVQLTRREEESLRYRLGLTEDGEKLSFREISAITGWSQETLRADYHRAIHKIRSGITSESRKKHTAETITREQAQAPIQETKNADPPSQKKYGNTP